MLSQPPQLATPIHLIERATERGFAAFSLRDIALSDILRELRAQFGRVTSSDLVVKPQIEARPMSLSSRHGTGTMPHHTDYAFRAIPARLILLANDSYEHFARPTFVARFADLSEDLRQTLDRSQWLLEVRASSFVVSGRFSVHAKHGRRWDTNALKPYDDFARAALTVIPMALEANSTRHSWSEKSAVLIDNWSCTHARGMGEQDDSGMRKLTRYEVW